MPPTQIFDGHNDLLARLFLRGGTKAVSTFKDGRPRGHLDAQKAQKGGFAGGLFAIWVPNGPCDAQPLKETAQKVSSSAYNLPLPPAVDYKEALPAAREQLATLKALEAEGDLVICTSASAIEEAIANERIAAVVHMEGAEAIDPDFEQLHRFYADGLRSLGPVWSRPTRYGSGVPFDFPATPDIGLGLTDDGKRLIEQCNALKILVDLSHLNEKGFWDVAEISDAPLVATHSNVHVLCQHARNLTDKQFDAIAQTKGLVGLNFATAFLRSDGRMTSDTPVSLMVDHLTYMVERMGEDCVALGSDFDGAIVPKEIESSAGLPVLVTALEDAGFGCALINKICHGNWLRVLRATWGE
ncbi:MAG: dipeptidase [Pseudomonadota bacterium]